MIVTYSPAGQDAQTWDWDPDQVRAVEAELLEKTYADTWDNLKLGVLKGSMRARRVLLWHLLRQQHSTLRLEDLDFASGELKVEPNQTELRQWREATVSATGISEEQRAQALALLDSQITAEEPAGKARSSSAG